MPRDLVMEEAENHMCSNEIARETNNEAGTKKTGTEITSKLTKRKFYILASLAYIHFWGSACYAIQAPFFPKQAESKGATPSEYGMVFSVNELTILLTSPIFGRMIPAVSPKFLVVAGSFLEGGSCTLFGVLDRIRGRTPFIVMAFLARIVEGIGATAFLTACFTIIAAEFPNSRGKALSLIEAFNGFGLIAGPMLGGILYQVGGFLLPFLVCGGMLLAGTALSLLLLPAIEDASVQASRNLKKLLMDFGVLAHMSAIVTTLIFIGFNAGTLEPHLRPFNLKPAVLGIIFITTGTVYAVTIPFWGCLSDKGADSCSMISLGYVITIIGTLFIGPVPFIPIKRKLWIVIVSLVVVSFGLSAKFSAALTGAVKITPTLGFPDNLATYAMISGMINFSTSLGAFIGPSLGGFLLDTIGYAAGTCVLLGQETIFLVLLVTLIAWRRRNSKNKERTYLLGAGTNETSTIIDDSGS